MKKNVLGLALALATAFLFVGCASIPVEYQAGNNSSIRNCIDSGIYGTPEDSTVLYSDLPYFTHFLQQNPKLGYNFYYSTGQYKMKGFFIKRLDGYFFLRPLPVGSELNIYYQEYQETRQVGNQTQIITHYAEYGCDGVDIILDKPGLKFVSSLKEGDPKRAKSEMKVLKKLLKAYKNTVWEAPISKRMEELSK